MQASWSHAQLRSSLLPIYPQDRGTMLWAILLSLLIHAGLLSLHVAPAPPPAATLRSTLDIVLVNAQTETAPLHAQALAQQNLDAGGNHDEGMARSPLPHTAQLSAQDLILRALRKRQAALEAEQQRLYTQLQGRFEMPAPRETPEPWQQANTPGPDAHSQETELIQARIAALEARIEHYNARPRQHFTGPSAHAASHAAYVENWRTRIELLGTQHYPEQARGRLYGSLQLTVYINRDGELAALEIDRPSEHPQLNLAARRIVQLAAPFPPLPADIAQDTDRLAISRTWHFTHEQLQTSAP